MNQKYKERKFKDEDVNYIASNGIKVMKTDPPSHEACLRYVEVMNELRAKYNVK